MSTFPRLKTGAVAQYPARREFQFSSVVQRYLDNSEQRYRDRGVFRQRWAIELSKLNEEELSRIVNFFIEQEGRFGTFDFEDPWTGTVTTGCRFENDRLPLLSNDELDSEAQITILAPMPS
jgi:hypothetical protein